jgi:hypothetical protein
LPVGVNVRFKRKPLPQRVRSHRGRQIKQPARAREWAFEKEGDTLYCRHSGSGSRARRQRKLVVLQGNGGEQGSYQRIGGFLVSAGTGSDGDDLRSVPRKLRRALGIMVITVDQLRDDSDKRGEARRDRQRRKKIDRGSKREGATDAGSNKIGGRREACIPIGRHRYAS